MKVIFPSRSEIFYAEHRRPCLVRLKKIVEDDIPGRRNQTELERAEAIGPGLIQCVDGVKYHVESGVSGVTVQLVPEAVQCKLPGELVTR